MPRPKRPARPQPNSVVASAATLSARPTARPRNTAQEWQGLAWHYFDTVGELRFAVNWVANALSRVTLHVEEDQQQEDGTWKRVRLTEGQPVDVLNALSGGEAGQSQMMHSFGVHLSVPGEAYLIGEPGQETEAGVPLTEDQWYVASTDEVSERAGRWYIDRGDGKRALDEDTLVIRVWRHHARKWVLADSPVRAVLPVLRILEALNDHLGATIDSRLAGAGILLLPSEMTFVSPPTTTDDGHEITDPADLVSDPFYSALTEAMMVAIEDRTSPAALVPIVVRAPGATLADARHLTFHSALDEVAGELEEKSIKRFALGFDVPPEVVLGQAESNHWTAWQIEESALKVHIEPLGELVTTAVTEQYERPALLASGYTGDVTRIHIVGDTTDLSARQDNSEHAISLYDRLELGGNALRRETGFDPTDAPTDEEVKSALIRKVAMASITPEQAAAAASMLGVSLPESAGGQGAPAASPPSGEGVQPTAPAERSIPEAAALLAAGEVLVLRAVERANNRVNRRGSRRAPFTAQACDLALVDAWDHAPRVAQVLGVDPAWFTGELDRYTRALLTEGADHQPRTLARVLCPNGLTRA